MKDMKKDEFILVVYATILFTVGFMIITLTWVIG